MAEVVKPQTQPLTTAEIAALALSLAHLGSGPQAVTARRGLQHALDHLDLDDDVIATTLDTLIEPLPADVAARARLIADAITSPTATAEAQRQAAASLTLVGQADATTIGALQEASRSDDPTVRNMSTLALGAQARVLGEGGGAGGLDPIADLLREYERASDLDSRRMFLAAFGNSGDVRTLPHLRAALAEPALAPTAAFGLRFIPSPEADVLLQQVALEGAPPVRAAALRAAFFRDPGAWMPVLQLAAARETYPPAMDAIRAALARYEEAG